MKIKKIIIIMLLSILFISCMDSEEVQKVKNGSLLMYKNVTIEELVNGFVKDPEWESFVADDGKTYVNIEGFIRYNGKKSKLGIQYRLDPDDRFWFNAMTINGEEQYEYVYRELMYKMYQNYLKKKY